MPLQRRLGETYVLQDAATSSNQHQHERVSHLTHTTLLTRCHTPRTGNAQRLEHVLKLKQELGPPHR